MPIPCATFVLTALAMAGPTEVSVLCCVTPLPPTPVSVSNSYLKPLVALEIIARGACWGNCTSILYPRNHEMVSVVSCSQEEPFPSLSETGRDALFSAIACALCHHLLCWWTILYPRSSGFNDENSSDDPQLPVQNIVSASDCFDSDLEQGLNESGTCY